MVESSQSISGTRQGGENSTCSHPMQPAQGLTVDKDAGRKAGFLSVPQPQVKQAGARKSLCPSNATSPEGASSSTLRFFSGAGALLPSVRGRTQLWVARAPLSGAGLHGHPLLRRLRPSTDNPPTAPGATWKETDMRTSGRPHPAHLAAAARSGAAPAPHSMASAGRCEPHLLPPAPPIRRGAPGHASQ